MGGCGRGGCAEGGDIHLGAFRALRGLLLVLLVTGALGIARVYFGPRAVLLSGRLWERPGMVVTWAIAGIPLCFS